KGETGKGPTPPRPRRPDRAADRWGARLRSVPAALSGRGARAEAERAGVRRGVFRGEGEGCAVLLGGAKVILGATDCLPSTPSVPLDCHRTRKGSRDAGDCKAVQEVLRDLR